MLRRATITGLCLAVALWGTGCGEEPGTDDLLTVSWIVRNDGDGSVLGTWHVQ